MGYLNIHSGIIKMDSETCPQCKDVIRGISKRIIKDSCGHEKCRVCLLQDVECCQQCEENRKNTENTALNRNVDANHTTVITCSKILNNIKKETAFTITDGALLPKVQNHENVEETSDKETPQKKENKVASQKRRYELIAMPNHIIVEGTPPTFFCNICKSKFKTKGHVKYHKFCLGDKKPYACEVCNKSFILRSQLSVHELIHSGKRPYVCTICDRAFRESGKLKRHMALHTEDKPHICDECGKNFKTLNSLRLHRIIHTGEKPFSCKYCKMLFNNSSNLKKHILSHTDEKTHMCEQCGKKFKQKWALTVHRRSHMHRRDFVCELCDKSFINNKDLKRHEAVHIAIKIYSCGICSMSFRRKDNLGRHFKNAHPDKKPEIIKRNVEEPDKLKAAVVDNPNAINVITSSPITRKSDINDKTNSLPRTCMNGPLKLAFKTSAFKKNYNINRDHSYDSNSREVARTLDQDAMKSASKILPIHQNTPSQMFPSVYSSVDEYYANRPHVIKNIKFKIPSIVNYPPENEGLLKTIMLQSHMNSDGKNYAKKKDEAKKEQADVRKYNSNRETEDNEGSAVGCQEAKDVAVGVTSVIVNSSDQKNIHWRRKMSHNIP